MKHTLPLHVVEFYQSLVERSGDRNASVRWQACGASDALGIDYQWAYDDPHPRVRARAVQADIWRVRYRNEREATNTYLRSRIEKAKADPSIVVRVEVLKFCFSTNQSCAWIDQCEDAEQLRAAIRTWEANRWGDYTKLLPPDEYELPPHPDSGDTW